MVNRIKNRIQSLRESFFLNRNIKIISGNKQFMHTHNDEIVITCLFQNGEKFISSFMEHHLKMGFKYFVFIDNQSTDKSIELLKKYDNVTIYSSALPYKDYKWVFKQFLTKKIGQYKWSLYLDIDELWDYPYSDKLSLKQFASYLNENNYTAVMAQMLDMYPKTALSEVQETGSLLEDYPMYSVANLNKKTYTNKHNKINASNLFHHRGGIHKSIFGIEDIYLTKIPLLKWDKSIAPHITSHTSNHVNLADVSTVLYHFKFTKDFYVKIEKVIREGSYWNGSATYKTYKEHIEKDKTLNLNKADSKEWKSVNQLINDEFIVISENYSKFVENNSSSCAE